MGIRLTGVSSVLLAIGCCASMPAAECGGCCCGRADVAAESVPVPARDAQVKTYPLSTCIVSGDAFASEPGETITKVYDGREIKFCCKDCVPKYEKDPAKYNALLDAAAQRSAVKEQSGSAKSAEPQPKATDENKQPALHE